MQYWLMKSEPDAFSIDMLASLPQKTEHWDGVRNYQARNMMRDEMKLGDQIFFYHSNCDEPGIVGIAEICRQGYPDFTAFDPEHKYFDPKSNPEKPTWIMVDVRFVRKLLRTITLKELKEHPTLFDFTLLRKGNRLSIMPVSSTEWHYIMSLE